MKTGDHYYDCLVSRLREEIDLRAKAYRKLVLWLNNSFFCGNGTKEERLAQEAAWNAAHRIERNMAEDIRASEDKWIEIQFKRQQADKERR